MLLLKEQHFNFFLTLSDTSDQAAQVRASPVSKLPAVKADINTYMGETFPHKDPGEGCRYLV